MNRDPAHTLILWPGDGAMTVEQYVASLPAGSPWPPEKRQSMLTGDALVNVPLSQVFNL